MGCSFPKKLPKASGFGGIVNFARFFEKIHFKNIGKIRPNRNFNNMNLDKYVSIPGVPGIHKIQSSRANGLFIFDTVEKRSRFVPVRGSNFTPLATISMYTDTEEGLISLGEVFDRVKASLESTPMVATEGNSAAYRTWFSTVLPEHDRDRVHIADIKKLVKWYNFMATNGLIEEAEKYTAELAEKATAEEKAAETSEDKA